MAQPASAAAPADDEPELGSDAHAADADAPVYSATDVDAAGAPQARSPVPLPAAAAGATEPKSAAAMGIEAMSAGPTTSVAVADEPGSAGGGSGGDDMAALAAANERRRKLSFYYGGLLFVMLFQLGLYIACIKLSNKYAAAECEADLQNWLWYQGAVGLVLYIPFTTVVFCVFCSLVGYDVVVQQIQRVVVWFGSLLNVLGAILACIAIPLGLFAVIWVIVGSAWTFGMDSPMVCPAEMYDFAKGYLIAVWILYVLGIPGVCMSARANSDNRRELRAMIERLKPPQK